MNEPEHLIPTQSSDGCHLNKQKLYLILGMCLVPIEY